MRPVSFPGDMASLRRRAYRAVLVYFLAVVAALMWPIYELAATIEPRILGIPFSLAYLVILLLGSFLVLLGLYLWEGRRFGHDEPGGSGPEASAASHRGHAGGADPGPGGTGG